jgi:hypothetical protein
MYSARLVEKLNQIAHQYKEIIQAAIKNVLSQTKYTNTGAAAASIKVTVIDGNENKAPEIRVDFVDYLVVLNRRKVEWTKLPDIKKLTEWAERKTDSREKAKKLAWAIAWDKKKHDTWKPKPWRKKSLSAVLKEMNVQILAAFDKAIDDDFQLAVNDGLK